MSNIRVLAIIPARGGSKGVPGKNIKLINGKPLIVHSIEQAMRSTCVDEVVVSSDSESILDIALDCGAKIVKRPVNISGDNASSEEALIHALESLVGEESFTHVVFLQCTSPIRSVDDIDKTIELVVHGQFDSALSVVENHSFLWRLNERNEAVPVNYSPVERRMRQNIVEYKENGSVYVMSVEGLLETGCRLNGVVGVHVMNEKTGYEIDTEIDFAVVDFLMGEYECT